MNLPITMTFDEYVGPFQIVAGAITGLQGARAKRMTPNPLEALGNVVKEDCVYLLSRARWSIHPETNARALKRYGPHVVASIEGVVVGAVGQHFLWLDHRHRGHGLTTEMAIAWFVMTREDGTDWRLTKASREAHGRDKLTKDGLGFRVQSYRTMVERNVIDPGGSIVPSFKEALGRALKRPHVKRRN